ncbi:MAG: DUF1800 domain-containing protein [Gemmataceae bacterium]|jgi:uncharacterized protein (DUF1800 family)|nr:DUF1800 domain-containing protein [Gemmataceae bacterium]
MPKKPYAELNPKEEWSEWSPSADNPWSRKWISHLYRRAGFGASREEIESAEKIGFDATIKKLFDVGPEPKLFSDDGTDGMFIRIDWVRRMLSGQAPLREKMALFWHNHFATSVNKVASNRAMVGQLQLFMKHGLSKFGPLLQDISKDPAMIIWLDGNTNTKAKPNENYAREIMELFSLGVGNYTEKDIREAARAFTGWHTQQGRFYFNASEHDEGEKVFFGQKGNWNGNDIVDMILKQPACPRFLARRLYAFFVCEEIVPPDSFLEPLVTELKNSDLDIGKCVERILRSKHFYSEQAFLQKIKSPVEFVIGAVRLLGVGPTGRLVVMPESLIPGLDAMGQRLFAPPNVKGWEGGRAWLSSGTLVARSNFSHDLAHGLREASKEMIRKAGGSFFTAADPLAQARKAGMETPREYVEFYGNLLIPGVRNVSAEQEMLKHLRKGDDSLASFESRVRDVIHSFLTMPEYQLN